MKGETDLPPLPPKAQGKERRMKKREKNSEVPPPSSLLPSFLPSVHPNSGAAGFFLPFPERLACLPRFMPVGGGGRPRRLDGCLATLRYATLRQPGVTWPYRGWVGLAVRHFN